MQLTDTPRRNPEATHQEVGDEAIIVNLSTGAYYTLNDTGALFWSLLDGRRTVADCARSIAAEYEVEVEVVEADLLELAEEFWTEGLILV